MLAYLDDVVIFGKTFDDHICNLEKVLERFHKFSLKIKPKKYHLFRKEIDFLGCRVSTKGIIVQEGKVTTVRDWPVLKNNKELASF